MLLELCQLLLRVHPELLYHHQPTHQSIKEQAQVSVLVTILSWICQALSSANHSTLHHPNIKYLHLHLICTIIKPPIKAHTLSQLTVWSHFTYLIYSDFPSNYSNNFLQ